MRRAHAPNAAPQGSPFSLAAPFVLTLLAVGPCACASIGLAPPRTVSETVIGTKQVEVPQGDELGATVSEEGTHLSVTAGRMCDVYEERTLRQHVATDKTNETPGVNWFYLAAGIGLAGAGAGVLVDSSNVAPTNTSSQNYNPVGPAGAQEIGAALLALGAIALAIPVVDLARASGTEEADVERQKRGKLIRSGLLCARTPASGAEVTASIGERQFPLGATSEDGVLAVNLDEVVERDLVPTPQGELIVRVAGRDVGRVNLARLFLAREQRAWDASETPACLESPTQEKCSKLLRYLTRFPQGPHRAYADEAMDMVEPALQRTAVEDTWRALHADECGKPATQNADHLQAACQRVAEYMETFPDSPHRDEAVDALRRGSERLRALRQHGAR